MTSRGLWRGKATLAQQCRVECARDRLLALAGAHRVADRDNNLARPRQTFKAPRRTAPRAVIEPIAQRRQGEQPGESGSPRDIMVEHPVGRPAEAETIF